MLNTSRTGTSWAHVGKLLLAVVSLYLVMPENALAAAGEGITELTGGVTAIFSAFREADFVTNVGVAAMGFIVLTLVFGWAGLGIAGFAIALVMLGGWFGVETIADTIYTHSALF